MQSLVLYAVVLVAGVSAVTPAAGPQVSPWIDSKSYYFHFIFSFIITGEVFGSHLVSSDNIFFLICIHS